MPTISVPQSLLRSLMEQHGHDHNLEQVNEHLPLLGTDIDACTEETLDIEIFPDRPDLLSGETLGFAMRPFLHGAQACPDMPTQPSGITVTVDPSLEHIRPVVHSAVVRGVELPKDEATVDAFIKGLMDHQEKLHFAIGRGRRRVSIGVHDLSSLKPPFRVMSVPGLTSFVPLACDAPMTIDEILKEHPKGVEYAHLLEGMQAYPLILDANDDVLSFPPIINGDHTTVTQTTRDFFIDVTGWDERACEAAIMLVCLQLLERGGAVETVEVTTCTGEVRTLPNGTGKQHLIPEELVASLLGRSFSDDELQTAINRMGGRFEGRQPAAKDSPQHSTKMAEASAGSSELIFTMPRWRFDVLHPVDIVEDLAIGHGYEDLGTDMPKAQLTAQPRPDHHLRRRLRDSMQGMGMMQIQSLTLSNEADQFENMRWERAHSVTQITNPITVDHTVLRQHLLPGLLRLLASNRHRDLPQSVYELGTVVRNHKNANRLAFLTAERSGGFAAVRGRIQALCNDLGVQDWHAEALPKGDGPWLAGRGAKLIINGTWVGCFGEIDPAVSSLFDLRVPLNGAEFDVDALMTVIVDPV
jgi:phenylalanyl-tRNA synthetase beta chain